ncbi:MAG: hypothetical protein Q8T03_05140 [Bacteroidota bacterium]|nr:hypothetical protein [Bacteroidota bacterium]
MKIHSKIITVLLFIVATSQAQWTLKLTSNVYLRTWKLDTKANKEEKEVDGATVILFQNGKQINQTTSSNGGEFTILIPQNGEFYLTVSYPGCNTKRMGINTQNVPDNIAKENYKPTFKITGGFIMVKPYPGINYSELSQDLIRVEYLPNKKAFDDTEEGTQRGLGIVSKIYDAEDDLFNRFCSTNKAGDVALAKPDCPLAKSLYEKAISIIPGEKYPIDQLAKVGLCLKDIELAAKKAADEAAAKKEAEIAAKKNEAATKEAADKKAIEDAIEKVAQEKAKAIMEEEAKLAKATSEKVAKEKEKEEKEKAIKDKEEKDKAIKEKAANERLAKEKALAEKKEAEKSGNLIIKKKTPEEIEKEAKLAKQKEGMAKSQAEDRDAMQADADKANAKRKEKEKAAREKAEKQKEGLAKSKAEDEAAMKEAEDKKEKARKDREAKEAEDKKRAFETRAKDGEGEMDKGDSDYSIPQVIGGSAEKYKEKIKTADGYLKMKRYQEAKVAYEDALKYKANDPYALSKLEDIEKLIAPK